MDLVGTVMSLLFNMLSRFITDFLPRSKHLSISWLQSLSAVILEPKKIKSVTVSIVSIILQLKINLIVKKKSFDDSLLRTHIPVRDTVPFLLRIVKISPAAPTLYCQVLSEIEMQAVPPCWSFQSVAVTDKMSPWDRRDKAARLPAGRLSYLLWLSVFSLVVPDLLELFQFCKMFMGTSMVSEEMLSLSHQFLKGGRQGPSHLAVSFFWSETEMEFQRACTNISCLYFFCKEFGALVCQPPCRVFKKLNGSKPALSEPYSACWS